MPQSLPANRTRSFYENQARRYWPSTKAYVNHHDPDPGEDVCFITVSNYKFFRGLEAMLLGLLKVYPRFSSPFIVFHDGSLGVFLRNRLLSIYSRIQFQIPDLDWVQSVPSDSRNRSRIGLLGYMNTQVFSLSGFRRLVVLDADLLVEGPLDYLWSEGNMFRLAADCGVRPWTPISTATNKPVMNSGVISVPGCDATPSNLDRMRSLVLNASVPFCPLLDSYADQKIWNQYLADQAVEIVSNCYNCNSKYLFLHRGGISYGLSVIHFAGLKPWMNSPWMAPSLDYCSVDDIFKLACLYWNDRYVHLLAPWRIKSYELASADHGLASISGRTVISDSIERLIACDLGASSAHLLLAAPEIFVGITGERPAFEEQFLERARLLPDLHIWMPFEWEPLLRSIANPLNLSFHWLLLEVPFCFDSPGQREASPGACSELPPLFSEFPREIMFSMVKQRLMAAKCDVDLVQLN